MDAKNKVINSNLTNRYLIMTTSITCSKLITYNTNTFKSLMKPLLKIRPYIVWLVFLLLLILKSNSLQSATYYVATNGSDSNPGTITAPFASLNKVWTLVQPGDIIYMRGGTYAYNTQQYLSGKSGTINNLIKVWAYPGEYPIITKGASYTATVGLYFSGNYVHFKNIEIKGFVQTSALAANLVAGFWVINASNNIFENLSVHDNGMGLRISGTSGHNKVINSDFFMNQDPYSSIGPYENADGLQIGFLSGIGDTDTSWVTGCRFWWNSDDGFDSYNNNGVVIIDNCWSFYNGYIPGTFNAGAGGNGFKLGPTSISLATQVRRKITRSVGYYNRRNGFNQNNGRCKMELYNNTAYLNGWKGYALSDDPYLENLSHTVKNNIGYQNGTYNAYISPASIVTNNTFLYNGNSNTAYTLNSSDFVSLTATGIDGPRLSDGSLPVLTFLQLAEGSDLIDKGVNIGLPFSGTAPDLGAFEFINNTSGNLAPTITNQTFQVNENSPNGTTVGTVVATDPNAGQTLTYSILSGNTNNAFTINASTGVISVATSSALNYEIMQLFNLLVKVQDNGTGNLSSQATITVSILNVNESPVITNQSFSINENTANGVTIGTVVASDPDAGQTLTYSILSGNTNGACAINSSTGVLIVANSNAFNFESLSSIPLVIKVQDNGTGSLSNQATVTITILNINEIPSINAQSFSINENASNGTVVGTVVASDPDAGQTLTYSILSGNTNSAFAISSTIGAITVANSTAINFETTPSFALIVKVQDNGSPVQSGQNTITVNLVNINEAPVVNDQTFSVITNAAVSTVVGTVVATDPDAGQQLTYSILSGNSNNAFALNASTGVITVNNSSAVNYTTTPIFTLVVKVSDNGTGNLSDNANITINVLQAANLPPVITNQAFSISENSPNGTTVGTVIASDPNSGQVLTYSIISGNTNSAFSINSSSGVITVANSAVLNYEVISLFSLIVKVQDNGPGNLSSQAIVNISIVNINEAPVIVPNQSFTIAENSANSTIVGTVQANDPDAGQALTYTIESGNLYGAFSIGATTGVITVGNSSSLNFELYPFFDLAVKVQDNGSSSLSTIDTVTIILSNINEAPVLYSQVFSVLENSSNGTLLGTIIAFDPDAGQSLSYSILSGNLNNAFAINPGTGLLSVANSSALNFESNPTFSLVVKAQDNGSPSLSGQSTITINLINVNEAPIINDQSFSVVQNSAVGTTVGTVTASDPDAGQTLTYTILSGNTNSAFVINSSTGVLSVNNSSAINYTTTPAFTLVVKVTDNGSGNLTDNGNITINVIQSSNQAPVIANQSFTTYENTANGTTIGTVIATDPNAGQVLTYTIISGNTNGAFSINSSTGVLKVANSAALNYEVVQAFNLVVKVQDNGTGNLSSQATVTVNIVNVNEPPVITNQTFSVSENSINGTVVGTVSASDPDAGQILSFTILSGNTNGAFSINSSTGKIVVANSAAINYETNPIFTLVVKVQDNGTGSLSSQATVTINLVNLNEPPIISNQSFSINENSPNGTLVGTVVASDPDAGQTLSYTILSGNTNGAFAINSTTGSLIVVNSSALNYEVITSFTLVVKVQDNGTGTLSSQANVVINILNINDAPNVNNQIFSIEENPLNGTSIGTVEAFDEDDNQFITYQIIGGNTGNAFYINSATGKLLVANANMIDYESNSVFQLLVSVADNGIPGCASQAEILVYIFDINDGLQGTPPIVLDNINNSNSAINDTYSLLSVENFTDFDAENFDWKIFPNPSCGDMNLELPEFQGKNPVLKVLNSQGKQVMHKEVENKTLQYFDLNMLPGGTYIIMLQFEHHIFTKKLIIN